MWLGFNGSDHCGLGGGPALNEKDNTSASETSKSQQSVAHEQNQAAKPKKN